MVLSMKSLTIRELTVICIITSALSSPTLFASELYPNIADGTSTCFTSSPSIAYNGEMPHFVAGINKDKSDYDKYQFYNCCTAKLCCDNNA